MKALLILAQNKIQKISDKVNNIIINRKKVLKEAAE